MQQKLISSHSVSRKSVGTRWGTLVLIAVQVKKTGELQITNSQCQMYEAHTTEMVRFQTVLIEEEFPDQGWTSSSCAFKCF